MRQFNDVYEGKTVLVTGHTGFKGSWLTAWLLELGAKVVGFSSYLPSEPCNFEVCNLEEYITHITGDVRDINCLRDVFSTYKPDIVFHLAAQPIVRRSYDDPRLTFETNLGGTLNVLECLRDSNLVKSAIFITSDKCYRNVEWAWGYRENDLLGGNDPYGASKACAEIACRAYIESFFAKENFPLIATVRAGNVIGGGDWGMDRIVPDYVRALAKNERLEIRSPNATRPWQHVLEPLSGYLWLGANLLQKNKKAAGESFNFGPSSNVSQSVEELIKECTETFGSESDYFCRSTVDDEKKESTLLKLNCDKALHYLNWHTVLSFAETVRLTMEWYKTYHSRDADMYRFSQAQIQFYAEKASQQELRWAIEEVCV